MREVTRTPVLEAKTSTGKSKFWFGRVVTDDKHCYLQSEAWTVNGSGKESKHIVSEPAKVTPKNVGKKNETTPEQQARAELDSKLQRQLDKGYHELGNKITRVFTLPMLAHSLAKKAHTLSFPCAVQPKYNGIRCLYNSEIGFWSRQGNELVQGVTAHLRFDTQGITVDGELLLPPAYTFQQSISAIKKFDPLVSPKLVYTIYDAAILGKTFEERWKVVQDVVRKARQVQDLQVLLLSPTEWALKPEDVTAFHRAVVANGFEGTIIRRPSGLYTPGHRSDTLLKFKDMQDAEFEIIGFEDGKGKDEGAVIFTCKTPEGREFNVRPEGTMDQRREMFKRGASLIGKKLTVRFQVYTDDRVPLFPVGVAVRDYE